jgi:hypothetical protein
MAVGNENLNSLKSESPRTPLPVRPTKNEKPDKSPSVEKEYEAPGQKIQNPFSQPSNKPPEDSGGQQIGVDEGNHEGKHLQGDQIGETKDIPSDDKLQPLEEEPDIMEQEAVDDNLDLPPFDWVAFREDYGTAIAAADKVEEELGVEFEKVCTVSKDFLQTDHTDFCRRSLYGLTRQVNMTTNELLNGKHAF